MTVVVCYGQKVAPMEAEEGDGEKRARSTRKRRITTFIIVTLVNTSLLALLWSQLLTPAQNQSDANSPGGSQSLQQTRSPLEGRRAPDFTLPVLSSRPAPAIRLASFKGKPVVLNFWASWCDPCKREAPRLQAAWQRVQSQGIVFLGIQFEDAQSSGLRFLQTYGITYQSVTDTDGSVAISYGVTGVPETFFINRSGVIVRRVLGELDERTLESNLKLFSSS